MTNDNIERLKLLQQSIKRDILYAKEELDNLYMELDDIEAELEQEESNG